MYASVTLSEIENEIVCYNVGNAITTAKVRELGLHFKESEGARTPSPSVSMPMVIIIITIIITAFVERRGVRRCNSKIMALDTWSRPRTAKSVGLSSEVEAHV